MSKRSVEAGADLVAVDFDAPLVLLVCARATPTLNIRTNATRRILLRFLFIPILLEES
jgi:hypothetical protein